MKNSRASVLLLPIFLTFMIAFANAQESAPANQTQIARADGTSELLQKYKEISSLPITERRSVFTKASATDKSNLWRVHLALHLVKRPELNEGQKRIVLDAISLSSPEFFATIGNNPAAKTNGGDDLQSLSRRALSAFSKEEAAEIFANMGGGRAEDELLQKYNQISALAIKQRKAAFRNASTRDKSDLWRTHLALFLAKRPDLNELQKEIIVVAMSLATPQSFELHFDRARGGIRSLENQVIVAFSKEDGVKIFATLGDDTATAKSSSSVSPQNMSYRQASASVSSSRWTRNQFTGQGQEMDLDRPSCVCSRDSDWCPIDGHCNGGSCSNTSSGCGFLWMYSCDGASCQ